LILIIADLTIGKGPFKATYKSDVRFNKNTDTIQVVNIEGPLKHLDNKWVFLKRITLLRYLLISILRLKINF